MSILYNRLSELCEQKGVTGYRMAKDAKVSVSLMTDLKMGRKKSISAEVANKLAAYFEVSVGYLLGTEDSPGVKKDAPTGNADERDLDASLIRRLVQLSPEEKEKVDAFVQGILASR
nr:MAG TPA: Cro/C1-type HTH DNA-binding domain protein [Caudoviricetes sp.]